MNLSQRIMTKNPCYKAGKKIEVKGLMLHSVGCSQPSAEVFINQWNKESYDRACVHAFIEPNGNAYQTLPWNHRGWHGGGSCNNTHIGVEMTEPSTITYTGGASWKEASDGANTRSHVMGTYRTAVELFAYLCKMYALNPLSDGVIISHSEGCKRGIASNHSDVEHIWKQFGLTMDQFRSDVNNAMYSSSGSDEETGELYRVQTGAFSVKGNADSLAARLTSEGFDTYIVESGGLYKVQVGAFKKKSNAESLLNSLKEKGYDAFITTESGNAVSAGSGGSGKSIVKGGKVKVIDAVTYNGSKFVTYYDQYDVIEVKGDRVVIGVGSAVTAAVNASNLQAI